MRFPFQAPHISNEEASDDALHGIPVVSDPELEREEVLHELFEARVDAHANNVAVEFGGERLTYRQLDEWANRLAHYLRADGIGPGARVALLLERSLEVYVAMLATLKTGAAYVPIHPDAPAERVDFILSDCGAAVLLTTSGLGDHRAGSVVPFVCLDRIGDIVADYPADRIPADAAGVCPSDLCYVIYTSGSTGNPKGVAVAHRSVCHFVRAEGRLFQVEPGDRVFQGLSISFDASVEEIWLAFHAGATLVAATPEMMTSIPDLGHILDAAGVTVVSTVPTVWSMVEQDIDSLRLLIFGGETCPAELVRRWWKPGRRLVNTYGPTETTVVASACELDPSSDCSIGFPLPNYRLHVVDEQLTPVPPGEPGELCIGGVGVARGYLNKPELTREKFIPDPWAIDGSTRMYRTGDRVRWNPDSGLEFLGRMDSQVKLRGFRIELGEIESVLLESEDIRAAAVTLGEDAAGIQRLVGYVVPAGATRPDVGRLRSRLGDRLPPYMVPHCLAAMEELPTLPSGKVDRAALPAPEQAMLLDGAPEEPQDEGRTPAERELLQHWRKLFAPAPVSLTDDFFLDLGGHSLLAARMVSGLRRETGFRDVSVRDVYRHPTVEGLARHLTDREEVIGTAGGDGEAAHSARPSRWKHALCGTLQAIGLYFVFAFRALRGYAALLSFFLLYGYGHTLYEAIAWSLLVGIALTPVTVLGGVAIKWLVLGRIRPGRYPLWGWYYVRWWFVQNVVDVMQLRTLAGTPLLPWILRLLGARVGKDVDILSENFAAFDVLSIGDGSSIEDEAAVYGYHVSQGELIIEPIAIGRRCFVGTRSVVAPGAVMEDDARLDDLSLLPAGARIPAGETWAGSPAEEVAGQAPDTTALKRGAARETMISLLYAALVSLLPIVTLVALLPGIYILFQVDRLEQPLLFVAVTPIVGALFVVLISAQIGLLKWLLLGRVEAGSYPVHGWFYIRHWIVDHLLQIGLQVIAPIHATLYAIPWYRMLGARLGRFVELSTASSVQPDLLRIDDGGTIADEVSLGAPHLEGGWLTIAPTRIDRRAFVGNSGVIRGGTRLGEGSLVGVLSISPRGAEAADSAKGWLGSPALFLPRRQSSAGFQEDRTYEPPRRLVCLRALVELFRVCMPPAINIVVAGVMIAGTLLLWPSVGPVATVLLLPAVLMAGCIGAGLFVALMKWLVVGRYRPFSHPLWSNFVWRLEFVNALYEFMLTPLLLEPLKGTPFLPWYCRLLGARIGRGVYMQTTGLLEWDLLEVGDHVCLNDDCVMQTHLFEDRILKASVVRIADGCSVGTGSVVLYDTEMERDASLNDLSILMKGESLQAGTHWIGSPARLQGRRPRAVAVADEQEAGGVFGNVPAYQ